MYTHHPLNSAISDQDDIYKLEYLMNQLLPHMSVTPQDTKQDTFNYTGEMNNFGQPTGELCYVKKFCYVKFL